MSPFLRYLPWILVTIVVIQLGSKLLPPAQPGNENLNEFSRLPVLVGGRLKPYDTVARTTLLFFHGKQDVKTPEGRKLTPAEWLLDVLFHPDVADDYAHFRIDNHEVLDVLGLSTLERNRFSFREIEPGLPELERQAGLAEQIDATQRDSFQRGVLQTYDRAVTYRRLKYSLQLPEAGDFFSNILAFQEAMLPGLEAAAARREGHDHDEAALSRLLDHVRQYEFLTQAALLHPIPPGRDATSDTEWRKIGPALVQSMLQGNVDPTVMTLAAIGQSWRNRDAEVFNELVSLYQNELDRRFPGWTGKWDLEFRFNSFQPFYQSTVLYAAAFLLAVFSWLKWPDALGRAAFFVATTAWILSTVGIVIRMYLEGRPPVTNLYSSAVFVGWASVALCLIVERSFRNALATAAGAVVGFLTLIVAHHLSLSGDTLEMMRAVLDSNFWLATHVVVITIGYSAVFLAGFLAIIYILRGVFTPTLDRISADALGRMVYGVICFATLFSLVGTILGGIWADQSWGRFWGWDPKENGALIIVLWNALILHARWGGMIRLRGLMVLAIFGNVVTSWSWFGTNMLGVGLHSYGFMDAAFVWLIIFVFSQLAIMAVGLIPTRNWRSPELRA